MLFAICITLNNFAFGWFLADWIMTYRRGEIVSGEIKFIVVATGIMFALDIFGIIH
jgi:hypothetical protein